MTAPDPDAPIEYDGWVEFADHTLAPLGSDGWPIRPDGTEPQVERLKPEPPGD